MITQDHSLIHGNGDTVGRSIATGLGWFSIGLGLLEIMGTRTLARSMGMQSNGPLLASYGAREITAGVGILLSKDPTPWVWARVLGDAMDMSTLAAHLHEDNEEQQHVAIALGNVAAVTALDLYCAYRLSRKSLPPSQEAVPGRVSSTPSSDSGDIGLTSHASAGVEPLSPV